MSKRSREEGASSHANGDAAHASKKLKKEQKRSATENGAVNGDAKVEKSKKRGGEDDIAPSDGIDSQKLSKEERRALKQAKKEQKKTEQTDEAAESVALGTGDAEAADKAQRKAEKAARKAAKKAAKAGNSSVSASNVTSGVVTPSGELETVRHEDSAVQVGYTEDPALAALPQSEIDTFIADKMIATDDPLNQKFRPLTTFKYLPVTDQAQRAPFANFTTPTPIQAGAWPYLLAGRDVIGVAETGSGKTLAFGVPCVQAIQRLGRKERKGIKACIVSPTRELASQIHEQLAKLCEPAGLKATCVYGGVSKDDQRALLKGTSIVVATPGRLNDFIQEGSIDLSSADYLVLDEADRMLDKGFELEVRKIISSTAAQGRQTLMFTATWPPSVRELASTFMNKPVRITIGDNASGELRANTRIVQEVEVIDPAEKNYRLLQLLKQYQTGKNKNDRILVFALYKKEATRIEEFIRRKGYPVGGIHGDLSQQKRTESLEAFKQGKVPLLVATDVAARGLDIPAVKVVINLTFPLTVEDYVHRIGRTGRAGQDGRAVTLFTEHEKGLAGGLINVLKAANQPVPEELLKFGTTVKKKQHDAYGAFYKDSGDAPMKKATKITFD